ncbi:MAG: hypothetical protein OQK04_10320 [Kangiellaceae bacterium]|nr:hypothetical protein [Kangiellaceae bacterium]MCW8999099.1 hypothetical protein [Kangiellaceae bacterium]
MPKFIISYLGGEHPKTPEEGQAHFAKYKEWLGGLGDAVVSPANPFKNTHTVFPDGNVEVKSLTNMSGFTVVSAESIDGALEMAKSCPFLDINGSLEVSELVEMNM